MKRYTLWLVPLLLLALAGCAHNRTTEDHAKAFFDDGKSYILRSLEKKDASPEQLDRARAILERHEATVTRNIAVLLHDQQDVLFAVTTGKDTATLVALENTMHTAHAEAVRSVGRMHEELQAAVGPDLWRVAMAHMEKKMSHYLRK